MLKKTLKALLLGAAIVPGLALAQQASAPKSPHTFTGNVGVFSQYIFRGLTQTDRKPAIQGGFDYSHAAGFYAGIWGSNISWLTDSIAAGGSYSVELDTYLGWKWNLPNDFGLDLGFLRYHYPGRKPAGGLPAGTDSPDTNEIYGAVSWKFVTLKYSYSLGDTFGIKDARGSDYIDLSASIPLGDSGVNAIAHVGHQRFKGTNAPLWAGTACQNSCFDYTDWKLGLAKEFSRLWGLTLGAYYTRANTKATTPTAAGGTAAVWNNNFGRNIGDGTFTVFVQKTF